MTTVQVMQAILTLTSEADIIDAMAANDVLDTYCWENPNDAISDMVNIFIQAAMNQDYKKIKRIAEYARDYLEDL